MAALQNKIDFIATIEVREANPNGDPLAGNEPRIDLQGYGFMSDVSIKRKIRNRMQDMGYPIFVQSDDRIDDGYHSLEKRYTGFMDAQKVDNKDKEKKYQLAVAQWLDVRAFGQVFTLKNEKSVRGPVSLNMPKTLSPISGRSIQITKSTNAKESEGKASDTIGSKHLVDYGVYLLKGSINPYFAERTGFSAEDAAVVKECLRTLFVNDASAARPEGSMSVRELWWITQPTKLSKVPSRRVFELVQYEDLPVTANIRKYEDYNIHLDETLRAELEAEGATIEYTEGL